MGACYGKGSGPNDPDKAPYGRDEKRRRRGKDAKNVGGRQSEEPGVDVVSRGERSPADNEYGGNDESDPEKRRTTTLGQRHGHNADDRHQIESAAIQVPTNKVVLQPATDDIFKQSPPKRDTRLSTGRPEDNAASLLDAKEERASRPRQPSVTRERVPPKADIPSSARVGDGPAIGRRSETTSTTSTTTKTATRRGRSEDSEVVTDEDVSIRILHQPKLKAESPWTVGSKSQTYSSSYTEVSTRVGPLTSNTTVSVVPLPGNAEDDDDKGQRSTVSSPPRVAGIGENEKKVVNGRREDVRPADVSGVIGGGRKPTFGEVPRAEVLKTEVEKAENATKQPKDFGFSERSRAAGTNVENGVLDSNQTKPVSKRTTSSKSDERGASPVQYRNGTASVTADVNSFIKPEKSEREAPAEQHEVNTVSGRTTTTTVVTRIGKESLKLDGIENGIRSSDAKRDSRAAEGSELAASPSGGGNEARRTSSTEGRKTDVSPRDAHSNIPSPTGYGSLRSQKKERTTSASSIKYTPTTTTSSLRRASSGRDAAAAGKAKEVHRRQSGVSCTVKERDDSHPVVPRKGDIRKLLCDFTDEMKGVVASYEFCPNTRSRLMNPIEKWIAGEETDKDSVERVWLLTGQAGMGKSAVTAEVYRKNGSRLVVGHFFKCNHPNLDYNDARFVLQSLARQLCGVVPDYAAALSRCTQLEATIEDGGAIIDLNEAFDVLFRQPLFSIELNRSTTDRVLVVLDAVDECRPDTRNQLLKLINSFAEKTPDWLYLLVTSRNENQILSQLENARTVEMKLTGDNLADIKKFLKQPMSKHMDRISLDGGLTQLVKKTDGNFLCAKVLSGMLDQLSPEKSIALREIESMFPKGTINCYAAVFKSFKDGLGKFVSPNELNDKYQSIAGLLCSAREPIPIDMLAETVKVDADCLDGLRPVLDVGDGCFALRNRHTADWLRNEQESGDLHVNISAGQKRLANWCLALLNHIGNRTENKYPVALQRYALKHAIWHLVEMPKQQENIAGLLCELRYISEKLQIPSVKARHLLHDYEHSHQTCFGESRKLISMADYMKKQPKLMQQMAAYHRFVRNQRKNLDDNPKSALNIAANYPSCDRIQQNALVELEGSPWLEDKSVVAETQHTAVRHPGLIEGADLSSDGKTVALMIASDERSCRLVMLNTITGEKKTADLDAKTIGDRLGSCVRFLADDSAIFVGSLSTFINPRQASPVPSGIDVKSVQMKEKYAIESCCVSRKFIVCGLSTLPTGGRSLHLAVLDLKAKKCTRLIEALKFRFGGSTQFGIKSCALSQDDALICSLVKETPRAQFVCTLWTISTGTSLYKVNMYGEYLTKCVFIGNDSILVGSGLKSYIRQENAEPTERTKLWNFKAGHQVVDWDEHEICSAFCIYNSGYLRLKWYFHGSRAYLETWKGKNVSAEAAERYRIDGVNSVCDVMAASDHLVVLTKEDIRLYNLCNLTQIQREENNAMTTSDVQIANMTWHPRREELVLAHISPDVQDQGVSTLNLHSDELTLSPAPVKLTAVGVKKDQGTPKVFHGRVTKTDACQYSSDGSMVVVKNGQSMVIWDIGNDKSDVLVSNDNSQDDGQLECVTSQKDNIVGVVRPDKPDTVQVFDLKSRHMIRQFSVPDAEAPVSDFLFLPYNGYLVAYYGKMAGTLVVWNPRNGEMVHQQPELDVSYIRLSPASDRLAINGGGDRTGGRLVLRSSDNKIRITLRIPDSWSGSPESSDAEFVADGTVLVGVAAEANVCRIWNAANGDVLRDWTIDFRWPVELIGAVTNAHVLLRDDRLMVVDIVTGQIVTSLSLVENLVRKTDRLGLRISPKGNTIVGSTEYGHLKILQCHNYGAVKRKSTLQIMKSSNK